MIYSSISSKVSYQDPQSHIPRDLIGHLEAYFLATEIAGS